MQNVQNLTWNKHSKVSALSLTLQVLDDAPETVAMGSNQHPLSLFDLWNDLFVPEGQCPGDGVLETLTAGKLFLGQVGVTPVLQRKQKCMLLVWAHTDVRNTSEFLKSFTVFL